MKLEFPLTYLGTHPAGCRTSVSVHFDIHAETGVPPALGSVRTHRTARPTLFCPS